MMLIAALLVSAVSNASAFVPCTNDSAFRTQLDAVKIYYDTQTGNTETCAGYIAAAAGLEAESIADATANDIDSADALIVGAPTWHTDSEDQRSGTAWDDWLYSSLPNRNVQGKKVAIFGVGDSASYSEYYCDAAGELYDQFVKAGAKVYGFVSTEGYEHSASKAEKDGKFVGCMFDEDNQYDLSEERANKWVQQLKDEGFF
uniref:Flavodoxin-like domain-containing protein n=1 Tax=Proboscia inermis TaxID=420281 RepID=A0A6T8KKF1_9STRA|mmetsp:Transcript_34501/g.34697  ORF Transcript_34501/g.34697 Transcript_34501/m.34697 type:complete len:202 (+) Transcript_34501:70-675(+)